jgi:hypothetical protein
VKRRRNSSPLEGEEAKTWVYPSFSEDKPLVFAGEGVPHVNIRKEAPSPEKSKDLAKAKSKIFLPPPQGGRTPHPFQTYSPTNKFHLNCPFTFRNHDHV